MKAYIVDVHLCVPDETYYPLNGRSNYNEVYAGHSLNELVKLLENDGWMRCGMILASDGRTPLVMFRKSPTAAERDLVNGSFVDPKKHFIAVAEETLMNEHPRLL
jgi:hypothetical protein